MIGSRNIGWSSTIKTFMIGAVQPNEGDSLIQRELQNGVLPDDMLTRRTVG